MKGPLEESNYGTSTSFGQSFTPCHKLQEELYNKLIPEIVTFPSIF